MSVGADSTTAVSPTDRLHQGLRAVLAHHVIFHWNRVVLSRSDQLALATLARNVILTPDQDTTP